MPKWEPMTPSKTQPSERAFVLAQNFVKQHGNPDHFHDHSDGHSDDSDDHSDDHSDYSDDHSDAMIHNVDKHDTTTNVARHSASPFACVSTLTHMCAAPER